jgi:hypothetical protein
MNVKVRRTNIQMNDAGSQAYFCTDLNCYSPGQTMSSVVNMPAGGHFDLSLDYSTNANGSSHIRYTVINQANTADSATFIVVYNSTPAGISTASIVKPSVSNPMPNPAATSFNLNYKLGSASQDNAKMVIYNMLGERVMETAVTEAEGTVKMDVSALNAGVYFCSLESEGKTLATRRLVVSH